MPSATIRLHSPRCQSGGSAVDPDSSEGWKVVELQDSREQGGALFARLEGVGDRTAAEALKGMYVGAPREALPVPAEDEFYWGDLIGLAVVTEAR